MEDKHRTLRGNYYGRGHSGGQLTQTSLGKCYINSIPFMGGDGAGLGGRRVEDRGRIINITWL